MAGNGGLGTAGDEGAGHHDLFFALKPIPSVAEDIWRRTVRYRARRGLTGRPTPPERLHVSLAGFRFAARLDPQVVERARMAAARLATSAFVVELNRLISWNGAPRPLVLTGDDGVDGVRLLYDALRAAMTDAGLVWRGKRVFEPHVTLLRDVVETPPERIAPVRWRVREVVLIHSPHGLGRHHILGRWNLPERAVGNRLPSADAMA